MTIPFPPGEADGTPQRGISRCQGFIFCTDDSAEAEQLEPCRRILWIQALGRPVQIVFLLRCIINLINIGIEQRFPHRVEKRLCGGVLSADDHRTVAFFEGHADEQWSGTGTNGIQMVRAR